MDIDGFLQRASARPWSWGEHDCTLMPADWVLERRGVDPAAAWRGTYSTAAGCERRLRQGGGLERVWAQALAMAGLSSAASPQVGDIGLVRRRCLDMSWRPVGAVFATDGWVSLTNAGLLWADAPLISAWSV